MANAKAKAPTKAVGTAVEKATRPQAIVDTIDFDSAMEDTSFPETVRRSKWTDLLDTLYDATAEDKVPRGEDGSLKFVRLGSFGNTNGARTQIRSLKSKGLGDTYEFKAVAKSGTSELWARVREVDGEEMETGDE